MVDHPNRSLGSGVVSVATGRSGTPASEPTRPGSYRLDVEAKNDKTPNAAFRLRGTIQYGADKARVVLRYERGAWDSHRGGVTVEPSARVIHVGRRFETTVDLERKSDGSFEKYLGPLRTEQGRLEYWKLSLEPKLGRFRATVQQVEPHAGREQTTHFCQFLAL